MRASGIRVAPTSFMRAWRLLYWCVITFVPLQSYAIDIPRFSECETRLRTSAGGYDFSSHAKAVHHPDFLRAVAANGELPNLGFAGEGLCRGEKMASVWRIFPNGAILRQFIRPSDLRAVAKEVKVDKLPSHAYQAFCKSNDSTLGLKRELEKSGKSFSERLVILHELESVPECSASRQELNRLRARWMYQPLLKDEAFELKVSTLLDQHRGCRVRKDELNQVRLLFGEEERIFGTLQTDESGSYLVGIDLGGETAFSPELGIRFVSSAPESEPCVRLLKQIANLPESTPEDRAAVAGSLVQLSRYRKTPLFTPFRQREAPKSYIKVGMDEAKAASQPLITTGIGPCIGVAILNRKTQKGALMHLSSSPLGFDVEKSFSEIMAQLGAGEKEAVVAGGYLDISESYQTLLRVLSLLDGHQVTITGRRFNRDYFQDGNSPADSLGVDPRSGRFY